MNRIKSLLSSVSGKFSLDKIGTATAPTLEDDTTARELCRMLRRCPICAAPTKEHGLAGHAYAHLGVTVLGEAARGRAKEFLAACEEQRWMDVRRYQEFDAKRDALVAYSVRCHPDDAGRAAVLIERIPAKDYEEDRIIACDVVKGESAMALATVIPHNEWRRLDWT